MKFLVLQHIAVEHPGILRDFMAADGIRWDAVELDAGEPIPPIKNYDALIVMGGPMDVFDENLHPWLVEEKRVIRDWVKAGRPYLGLCLGHQLLADALGGKVERMARPEVGILSIELTEAGRAAPLFAKLDPVMLCLQWHGCEVGVLPPGGVGLARSPACAIQAFRIGERAYGLQYHVELTAHTIAEWGAVPAYAESLERSFGSAGLAKLEADAKAHLAGFAADARKLYDNFRTLVAAART